MMIARLYLIAGLICMMTAACVQGAEKTEKDLKDAYAIMYTKKKSGLPDVLRRKIFSYNKRGYPVERFLEGHTGYVVAVYADPGADGVVRLKSHSEDGTIRTWNTETGICEHIVNSGRVIEPLWYREPYVGKDGKRRVVTRANDDKASRDFRIRIRHLEPPAEYKNAPLNAFEIAFGVANSRNSQENPIKNPKKWDIFSFGKAALGLGVLGFAAWWLWKNCK